jgi:virginiamycin B lyase
LSSGATLFLSHLFACALLACPGFSQTPPPQAAGYTLVFSDDFSTLDLSANGYGNHLWYPGLYYQPQKPNAGSIFAGSTSGLTLHWDRNSGNDNTSLEGCANNASYCTTFRYGYVEACMKWDITAGAWPAFWMITKQSVLGAQHVGEIDIFEGQGNDPNHFYGTVNEWTDATLTSSNSPSANRFALPPNTDFGQWHTYGVLWVPGRITWYFDNVAVGSAITPAIFDEQDFFLILGSQEGNNWQAGNLTGVSAQTIDLNVAWVHVFQSGGIPVPVPSASTSTSLAIATTDLPVPTQSLPYAVQVRAKGGNPPYSFELTAGALPPGLQFDARVGAITSTPGVPLAAGPYSFTVKVTDTSNAIVSQNYSGSISAVPLVSSFDSYALPARSNPNGITVGPDGALWFTTLNQAGGNLIGRITTSGSITTIPAQLALASPGLSDLSVPGGDIVAGPNGALWFTARDSNTVGEIASDMTWRQTHAAKIANSGLAQVSTSPTGFIWYTEASTSMIGRLDASGNLTEYATPSPSAHPLGIAVAPDGSAWFTEPGVNKIGYVSQDGSIGRDFSIPTPQSYPTSIVLGPDNAFWFTEFGAGKIGRIDLSGNIQEAFVSSDPVVITVGPDAALYFTETSADKIGRITIFGTVTEIAIPDANSGAAGIVTGPDGSLWFTEMNQSRIGRLSFVAAPTLRCDMPAEPLQVGANISTSCSVTGGKPPFRFGATGNPPPGILIDPNTGAIFGTVTIAGTFNFTIAVEDNSTPAQTAQQTYTMVVNP